MALNIVNDDYFPINLYEEWISAPFHWNVKGTPLWNVF